MATIVSRNNSKPSRWCGVVNLNMAIDLLKVQYIECIFNYLALPFGFLSTMLDAESELCGCT